MTNNTPPIQNPKSKIQNSLPLPLKRLLSHPGLTLALAAGLLVAVALATAVPLYAGAVSYRLLAEQLAQDGRPPFAFLFRYLGDWHGALEWEDIQAADAYLTGQASADLGLPPGACVRHVRTAKWAFYPAAEANTYADVNDPLAWLSLGFLDGVENHIRITEGAALSAAPPGDAIPALAARALADQLGLQVGETYLLADPAAPQTPLRVQIVGVWEARDADPAYWLYLPRNFAETLLTGEAAFRERVAPQSQQEVGLAAWYLVADGEGIAGARVGRLQERIAALRARLDGLLPKLSLDASPEAALQTYAQETARLTALLYAFGSPILGLLLTFVGLAAGMAVQREQGEIAALRSRGARRWDIVALYVEQWGLLALAAWLGGGPLGAAVAALMTRTRSFLRFAPAAEGGAVRLDAPSWGFGLIAAGLALLAAAVPAYRAARHTIVTGQRREEKQRAPFWQRYFLDVALLLPALYGYILLRRPAQSPLGQLAQGDLFSNPLLFLVPAIFIFAWALILLRCFPLAARALARLARGARSPVPLLVCRDLAEHVRRVSGPLLLLTLTTALATFSASLALTLDGDLVARIYYQVGADARLAEQGESVQAADDAAASEPGTPAATDWVFLPIAEHRSLPGVRGATRVGDYTARATLGGKTETGRFLGIDRLDLPGVAFFREDFATTSLGELMNALAAEPRGVLVERRFLARHGLKAGDPLLLRVDVLGEPLELTFTVVGALDYFPTLYPEDGPFFIGNLSYLFTRMGGMYPYDVWLATEPDSLETIVAALNERGAPVVAAWDARARILAAQQRPGRQGLFGLLTFGFGAAALLTVTGLALHALLTFRERRVELGVLRAIGLSAGQMQRYLAGSQALLLVLGLAAGTLLGASAGELFVPFLQADAGTHPHTPPFIARIAWSEIALVYALFAAAALATIGATLIILRRMRLAEAIKLGETFS